MSCPAPTRPAPTGRAARTAVTYLAFAALAAAVNIGMQQLVISALPGAARLALPTSVAAGTLAGFAVKYVLDKRFIFADPRSGRRGEIAKLALYGGFAVLTTGLFWLVEFGAFYAFGTVQAKYAGAIVGLAIGYAAKYALDRRYTFRPAEPDRNAGARRPLSARAIPPRGPDP